MNLLDNKYPCQKREKQIRTTKEKCIDAFFYLMLLSFSIFCWLGIIAFIKWIF